MKRWHELSKAKKVKTYGKAWAELGEALLECDGMLDTDEQLEAWHEAVRQAEEMRTPWFAFEYMMDAKCLRMWMKLGVKEYVQGAVYLEDGEYTI